MVKVGDKIRILYDGADHANVQRGDEFVVSEVFDEEYVEVEGEYNWLFSGYSYEVIHATPPQKITQNGYEYELVGPVKPDWLVDGAWVVDNETGRKYRASCDNGAYTFNNGKREVIIDFISLPTRFRPHTASDWKWGDWAMYKGKRVFVMTEADAYNCVSVSYPDIYPLGSNEAYRNFLLVSYKELTPTF